MEQVKFVITTAADGSYTSAIASAPLSDVSEHQKGPFLLYAVEWVDGTLADGVDAVLSITDTLSGVDKTLLTLTDANNDAWYYPRVLESDNAGVATTFYSMQVVEGTLKLVVSSGGNVATGACIVYLLEA